MAIVYFCVYAVVFSMCCCIYQHFVVLYCLSTFGRLPGYTCTLVMKRLIFYCALSLQLLYPLLLDARPDGDVNIAPTDVYALPPDLCVVSTIQFANVEGTTPLALTFSWSASDSLNKWVGGLNLLCVAGWNGTDWVNLGQAAVSGNLTAGTITTPVLIPDTYTIYALAAVRAKTFNVTGGGSYCSSTDPGVLIGLSGSELNILYQLRLNNNNIGVPVQGTGGPLSFGVHNVLGSYVVSAIQVQGNCATNMFGLATVNAYTCNASISDPCVCKNNATNLLNGQFDETIEVNAPANQNWTVSAVIGLYQANSPAPPAQPIAVTVGTPLTYLGANVYQLKGIHIDAMGYSITISNGLGTTLSIGNTCSYPNPSFGAELSGPFCLYSDPVNLVGIPGDNNIVGQGFTINGTPATQFNPGAGLGTYTIEYTVDGGTPKSSGPNDPGCIQKIIKTVQVVATSGALVCNNLVNVSLDADCESAVTPDDMLDGVYPCYDDYEVALDRIAPYGNGPWSSATITVADLGNTYSARVTHLGSGNTCVGSVKIEDKLAPVLTCTDITLFCPIVKYDPNYIKNTLNIPAAFPTVVDCSTYTLTYTDVWVDLPCGKGFNGVNDLSAYVSRKWTAKDSWNNSSTCIQYIYFKRLHIDDVQYPADYTIACGTNVDTDPSITGGPFVNKLGINWTFYPDPGYCEMQAIYNDQYLPDCDGTFRILRTWTMVDWCLPINPFPPAQNPVYYTQLIKVLDGEGPAFVCPASLTVSTDPYVCCGTIDLPNVILTDNCARINGIGAVVSAFDLNNQAIGTYTVPGMLSDFPGNNLQQSDTLGNVGFTPCLPLGNHTLVYTASDDCGNTRTCSFKIRLEDLTLPVPVCDQLTQVSLGPSGTTVIPALNFDDGSYDNCGSVYFKVRRMSGSSFNDAVTFSCSDVGNTITVVLRVYDVPVGAGSVSLTTQEQHANDCMVQVVVDDKIKPVCTAPANVTVSCSNFDPSLALYGNASVSDNCCLDDTKIYQGVKGLTHNANYTLFDTVCNKGTIQRNFTAFDCNGLSSACTQRVVVQYAQDYFVRFPNDVLVSVCDGTGNYGAPSFFGEDCELLGVSFEDQVFTVVPDACFKIERTWTIINWCTFNPNLNCVQVPNPNPNAIENHPSNLPGPVVSAFGTLAPWSPTTVKVQASDPVATNYSVFYDPNVNCYKYKQLIKIIDTQDPVAQCPNTPVTYCDITANDAQSWNESYWYDPSNGLNNLCEGFADLSITATDACSGADIRFRYLLFLDLDGDGNQETVVSSANLPGINNVQFGNAGNVNYTGGQPRAFDERPVPINQQYRFGLDWVADGPEVTAKVRFDNVQSPILLPAVGNNVMQGGVPQLPYGTHKIQWFVEDGCGNETSCTYDFTIKDCKKPTVVCLNGLSVNIMPNQMISLWASDFLQYAEDNCTPVNQLKIAVRKSSDATPGFPVDGLGNPLSSVTFNCQELGTQQVKLWVMDQAGNADFCETTVVVQDNDQYCPLLNVAKVGGALKTELGDGLDQGNLNIIGNGNGIPWFTFNTKSNTQGNYTFNAIPLSSNVKVTPYKDDNPLNGVSTYDLVLISKHILGLQTLDSPFKMIAADANNSNSITTFDIVELRKLILGIYSDLPTNTSWRFVDKSYVFPNPSNPFQFVYPDKKQIAGVSGDILNADFVAIKVGDVNNTAIANAQGLGEDRGAGTLYFELADQAFEVGQTIEVRLEAMDRVAGLQFTLQFQGLEFLDLEPGIGMQLANFGLPALVSAQQDMLTVSYDGNDKAAFVLHFRAIQAGKLSDLLHISSAITCAEAYGLFENEKEHSSVFPGKNAIALRFKQDDTYIIQGVGFELYQNQPNPFENGTVIGFNLPAVSANAPVALEVYDEIGRLVHRQQASFGAGYNRFQLQTQNLGKTSPTRLLYYKVITAMDSAVRPMIQIR